MKAKKGKIQNINYPDIANDSEIKKVNLLKGIGDNVTDPENWSSREGLV